MFDKHCVPSHCRIKRCKDVVPDLCNINMTWLLQYWSDDLLTVAFSSVAEAHDA